MCMGNGGKLRLEAAHWVLLELEGSMGPAGGSHQPWANTHSC